MKQLPLFLFLGACLGASAQPSAQPTAGKAPARTEFISYSLRDAAEAGKRSGSPFYLPLKLTKTDATAASAAYAVTVDIPMAWRERDVFLHVEGAWSCLTLYVNDRIAGYAEDSKTPSEFLLSPLLTEGPNRITLKVGAHSGGAQLEAGHTSPDAPASIGGAFIYSQPRTRVEDFTVHAIPWGGGNPSGRFKIEIALSNSYNYDEDISIGYDIYSPQGVLQYYDKRPMTLPGNGRDTIRFEAEIYKASQNFWSPAKPALYRCMIIVWKGSRIIEYIPFKAGFSKESFADNLAVIRDTPAARTAVYNVAPGAAEAAVKTQLAALKKKGVTLLTPGYPQPYWFYDLCDAMGFWVLDQANINAPTGRADRRVGGTPSNDPRFADAYLERQQYMFSRVKNHPCIAGWSMGGNSGNGYCMYKSYRLLKSLEPWRPVVYRDAQGEWNTDL